MRLAVGVAPESDGGSRLAQTQVVQQDLRQPIRQSGIDDQEMERSNWLETKQRVHDERKRAGVPELRCIGLRIGARRWTIAPSVSAHAFGYAMLRIELREVKQRRR